MGCAQSLSSSAEAKEASAESRRISRELAKDGARESSVTKLLLLGAGDSGKSTIMKQVKLLHTPGFTREELLASKPIVRQNVLDSMSAILESIQEKGEKFTLVENADGANCRVVVATSPVDLRDDSLLPRLSAAVTALWRDAAVRECYESRRHLLQVQDSARFFFDCAARVLSPGYAPSREDFLKLRVRTTGVVEAAFQVVHQSRAIAFRIIDVGGQRSERRKWIHCFENVDAILFLVAISEYNQVLVEDGVTNRMDESLRLWDSIVNNAFFCSTSFLLFLNKVDLFDQKLPRFPLEQYHPAFAGSNESPRQFIANLYLSKVKSGSAACKKLTSSLSSSGDKGGKKVFHHFTCATDTGQIKVIFKDVTQIIIEKTLREHDLI